MFQFAILLLQVTRQVIAYLEQRRLISEGERRQIARELARTAQAASLAKQVREHVGRMTDDEIDAALRGDYRD